MKKKLALLLALAMIVSMLPVTVFGADPNYGKLIGTVRSLIKNSSVNKNLTATIEIDTLQFATDGAFKVEIDNGQINRINDMTEDDKVNGLWIVGNPVKDTEELKDALVDGQIIISYEDNDDNDSPIEIKLTALRDSGPEGTQKIRVATYVSYGLTASAGDPVVFTDTVTINKITIGEKRLGSFNADAEYTVTLKLQGDKFNWGSTSKVEVGSDSKFLPAFNADDANVAGANTQTVTIKGIKTGDSSLSAGDFFISGLTIGATEKAKVKDTVKVDVTIQAVNEEETFKNDGKEDDKVLEIETGKKVTIEGLTVATLGTAGLKLASDKATEIYSGEMSDLASFTLTELAPNSFPTANSKNSAARFVVPEGVKINSAEVAVWSDDSEPDPETFNQESKNLDTRATDGHDFSVALDAETLYLVPAWGISSDGSLFNVKITLNVSVVPGYANDIDSGIAVTFEGSLDKVGIENASGKVTEDLATVADRIEVDATTSGGLTYSGVYVTGSIDEIVIIETEPGALKAGTELWLYIENTRLTNLSLDVPSGTFQDNTTDLRARVSRKKLANLDLPAGVVLEILNESRGDDPGTITIPGAFVSGTDMSGNQEIKLVVSGSAVAENNEIVAFDADEEDDYSKWLKDNKADIYFDTAYTKSLFGGADDIDEGPGTVPGTGTEPGGSEPGTGDIDLGDLGDGGDIETPTTPTTPTVPQEPPKEIFSIPNGGSFQPIEGDPIPKAFRTVNGVGYVAMRVLIDQYGMDWSYVNDVATITDGGITVEMTKGKNVGKVNGVEKKITDSAGNPAAVRMLEEGRLFVPARFVFESLGYDVQWDAETSTMTLIPPGN